METPRLADAADLFLTALKAEGCTANTVAAYQNMLTLFVRFAQAQGCETVGDVSAQTLRLWLIHCRERGLSGHSVFNSYRLPRRWFNWLAGEGLLQDNPFQRVPKPKLPTVIKRALTDDEVKRLLHACDGKHWLNLRDKALILLLLSTGLRAMEAHAMKVADAEKDALLVQGKGNKQRMVPLLPQTRLALKRYVLACPYITPQHKEAPLWWGTHAVPLTLDGLKQAVRDASHRAGMSFGAHQLRRTFATRLLQDGASMEHVRLLMGHSDYTVLRQYLHLTEQDLQETVLRHNPLKEIMR